MKKLLAKALLICGLVLVSFASQGTTVPSADNNADYPESVGESEI